MVFVTSADISAYYGRALSAEELAQIDAVIGAACAQVEGACGRSWDTGAIVDEYQPIEGNQIFLGRSIVSVESIKVRTLMVNSQIVSLTANEWQILDARAGRILINNVIGPIALVSYTRSAPPADVKLAAVILAGLALTTTTDPNRDADNYKSFQIARELNVVFRDDTAELPGSVARLLAPYLGRTAFA